MKSYVIFILSLSCVAALSENHSNKLIYQSEDKIVHIFLVKTDSVPQDSGNEETYVVLCNDRPRICIQKAEGELMFLNIPRYNALAYVVGLELKIFDYSKENLNLNKIDTSLFEKHLTKRLPDARRGAIMHEWISSLKTLANNTFTITYIYAKHPVTIQMEAEVKLSFIDGELHTESRVINENQLKWGEVTPPDHIKR